MADPKNIEQVVDTARSRPVSFVLGLFVAAAGATVLYETMRVPNLRDQIAVEGNRIVALKEQLEASQARAASATNVAKSSSFASPQAGDASNSPPLSLSCKWTPSVQGAFGSSRGDYKAADWKPDDGSPMTRTEGQPHTSFVRIVSDRVIRGSGQATKYEKVVGGKVRNPQFSRIEFVIPPSWFGKEVRMRAQLRWMGVRLVPAGYPGVVAVNLEYRDQAFPLKDQYIILHGEHFDRQAWEAYEFPTFRLPPGTASAKVRIGLHGAFGTLDVDNVSFEVCE